MKIFKIILAAMFAAVSLLAALSEDRIKPGMQEATQSVIAVLKDKSLSDNDKIDKIFAVFDPFFDFNQMAKIALSKRYKNLTDEQRTAFGEAFERRLKASYVDKLLGYTDQEIVFKDASKPNAGRYWLNGELLSGGETYGFVYKFYDAKERGWLIYDVEILGVSILQTYRSQFDSLMENESFESLLSKLNQSGTTK
jgi:toluene tolerance protein ttg2D